jgi:hypothetical protein
MEFIEGKCPECGGELRVPQDLDKLICMYCGKEITKEDILNQNKLVSSDSYEYAMNHIPDILLLNKDLMDFFKKTLYVDAINNYTEQTKDIFLALEKAYHNQPHERETIMKNCADQFIRGLNEDLNQNPKLKTKKQKDGVVESYKMIMAIFVIPMIGLQQFDGSEEFIDILMKRWLEEYPNMAFSKGTFEQINDGFRKKGFCYITTAVCETLNKEDDCYELTMFRQFRDNYLLLQPEGKEIIEQYYELAPRIVDNINHSAEREHIYHDIWKDDLSVCLKDIETGDLESCKKNYMKMVRKLQRQYI